MRTAFITQLLREAETNKSIFLVVGDLGFSVVEPFARQFPDRFLNAGVAEQNMIGVSAGLAKEGYNVFVYSIGNFPTLRCIEQIRNDVCYHQASVKIIAVGGGYAYGPLGFTHHATEEIGILRTLPNLSICVPGDPVETSLITTMLAHRGGPGYMRLGKAGESSVHTLNVRVEWGKMNLVKEGTQNVVLATGSLLKYASDFIANNAPGWGLYSAPFLRPFDKETLGSLANRYARIITLEEHQRSAGFGSIVLEELNDLREAGKLERFPEVKRIAIPDHFVEVAGTQSYLRELSGLVLKL